MPPRIKLSNPLGTDYIPVGGFTGLTRVAQTGPNPALFLIEGTGIDPYSAFSMRCLSSAYLLSGAPCMRVRRGADNDETDIGFVEVVPGVWYLDTTTLAAFANASPTSNKSCFVVRMYDQTGNGRDRYSGIANRQPFIVDSAGNLEQYNNYIGARFSTQNHTLQTLLAYGIGNSVWPSGAVSLSSIYVNKANTTPLTNSLLVWDNGGSQYAYVAQLGSAASAFANYVQGTQYKNDGSVFINTRDEAFGELYDQRYILEDYNFTKWVTAQNNFGGYGLINGTSFNWNGYYLEEINYEGNQEPNRVLIMSYITGFYQFF